MKLKSLLAYLVLISTISCMKTADTKTMEIRYTSMNDVYGNYIFNFEDNADGIKKINDFAVETIKSSKKISDSVNTEMSNMTKEGAQDFVTNQSLPTMASNIIFYKALGDFDGQPQQKDILMEYVLDENTFQVKSIIIPNIEIKKVITFEEKNKSEKSLTLVISLNKISLSDLKLIMEKVKQIGLEKKTDNFQYHIENAIGTLILTIEFQKMGEYVSFKIIS